MQEQNKIHLLIKLKSRYFLSLVLALPFLVLSCNRSHPVDKKEAVNNLKILNADIISFIYTSSKQPGFKALGFLLKQASAPLPFRFDTTPSKGIKTNFSFAGSKGIYCWDTVNRMFLKKKDTSVILIRFPMPGQPGSECRFFLFEYETGKTRTKPEFPVKIRAKLFTGDKEELSISHLASISEEMVSGISTGLTSDSLEFKFTMNREGSFAVKSGKLNYNLRFLQGRKEILRSDLKLDIDYHPPLSYSIQYIRIEQKLFTTELSGTIDYGSINPTCNQYDKEFNKNTNLEIINTNDRGVNGTIVLSPAGEEGRFDYFIRFTDGSESRLTDQLPVLKKIPDYLKYLNSL